MNICIKTLGCKVNAYESSAILEDFINHGYKEVNDFNNADVIVINTCTVTNQSDSKSRKVIRQARRDNPDSIIVVCGCSSEHHKEDMKDLGADILIGNYGKMEIYNLVEEFKKNHEQLIKFTDMRKVRFENKYHILCQVLTQRYVSHVLCNKSMMKEVVILTLGMSV